MNWNELFFFKQAYDTGLFYSTTLLQNKDKTSTYIIKKKKEINKI